MIKTKPVTKEYEAGYEAAFGERTGPRTGRWVWDPKQMKLVPIGGDWQPSQRHVPVVGDSHYDNLRAPDGTPINSRTKHRDYMKRHGLTTADDFKGTWERAAKERESSYDPSRRHDIGRAVYEHFDKRR